MHVCSALFSFLLLFCFVQILDGLVDSSRPINSFASQPWHSCHKLIYVRPNPKTGVPVGHWPIPESFWPDQNSPTLVSKIRTEKRILHLSKKTENEYYSSGLLPLFTNMIWLRFKEG